MRTEALEACGVWIEILNDCGHTVAQHVIDEWHGRPVPQRGDCFEIDDIGLRKLRGVVIGRRFDLQQSADGEPQLWVRLVVRLDTTGGPFARPRATEFSLN